MAKKSWDKTTYLTIGRMAKLFGLNTSTLRFWEDKDLLESSRNKNDYRRYDYQSMLDVCDLVLMKNMGLTIRDMQKAPSLGLYELEELYEKRLNALQSQIHDLQETLSKISETRELMAALNTLCLHRDIVFSEPDIHQLIPHRKLDDPTVWRKYFSGQYQFGVVFLPNASGAYDEIWGWIPKEPENVHRNIWEHEPGNKTFAQCMLWVNVEDRDKNNIKEIEAFFEKHHYRVGMIAARYICTANEYGSRNDFYKAWVEIKQEESHERTSHSKEPAG